MKLSKLFTLSLLLLSFGLYAQPGIKWHKAYGGSQYEECYGIIKTAKGYVFTGYASSTDGDVSATKGSSDMWMVVVDTGGKLLLEKSYGGTSSDVGYCIAPAGNGGYLMLAATKSKDGDVINSKNGINTTEDIWGVKVDSAGAIDWSYCYGGSHQDFPGSVAAGGQRILIQTKDGGYIFAGSTMSGDLDITKNKGITDIWLVKISGTGNLVWQKTYGGSSNDNASGLIQTKDNNFLVCGSVFGNAGGDISMPYGDRDAWLLKVDDTGKILWKKNYGGTAYDAANAVIQTPDGGYLFTGITMSTDNDVQSPAKGKMDIWTVKVATSGAVEWERRWGGSENEVGRAVLLRKDGTYLVAGETSSFDGDIGDSARGRADIVLLCYNASGILKWQKTIGGSGDEKFGGMLETEKRSIILGASTNSKDKDAAGNGLHGNNTDAWIMELDTIKPTTVATISNVDVSVYPTITTGAVYINLPEGLQEAKLIVTDAVGKVILRHDTSGDTMAGNRASVNLSGYGGGVYFVHVIWSEGHAIQKILLCP